MHTTRRQHILYQNEVLSRRFGFALLFFASLLFSFNIRAQEVCRSINTSQLNSFSFINDKEHIPVLRFSRDRRRIIASISNMPIFYIGTQLKNITICENEENIETLYATCPHSFRTTTKNIMIPKPRSWVEETEIRIQYIPLNRHIASRCYQSPSDDGPMLRSFIRTYSLGYLTIYITESDSLHSFEAVSHLKQPIFLAPPSPEEP